ncbi:MAG: hypothetical protein K1X82_09545 [Bacteroidia bacterium]|nr:hypothetical protein [Bacteroidia bacterium]
MFKNVLLSVGFICFFSFQSFSQAPQAFNYQAVVRTGSGELLGNQTVSFRISILNGNSEGDVIYQEKHLAQTNELGLVVFSIGKGSPTIGEFSTIDWGANSRWIKVEFKKLEDTDYTLTGVTQLLSVPYALYAENAGGADRAIDFVGTNGQTIRNNAGTWEATSTIFNNGTNVGIGTTSPVQKLDVTGNLNLASGFGIRFNNAEMIHSRGGSGNLFLGLTSGLAVTTGTSNFVGGQNSGRALTTGNQNVILGTNAGRLLTTGYQNAFIGVNAGFSSNGYENAYIGMNAGYYNTGFRNTFIGRSAGFGTDGVTTGSNNTFIGSYAGTLSTTGSGNLALGTNAQVGATTSNAIGIGNNANGEGLNSIAIGYNAKATATNSTAIGTNSTATAANVVVLGSVSGANGATITANVGIGTTAPVSRLHVVGQTQVDGQLKITGGNPGAGKALVSDAAGLASWQSLSSSNVSAPGSDKQIVFNDGGVLGAGSNFVYDKTTNQLGVGTATPNASAVADFTSSNKGVLFPRLTTTQRNAIASPPDGLVIYNTTINCFEFRLGGAWKSNCDTCATVSASAGADQTNLCPYTLALSGNTLSPGLTGLWTIVSGTGGTLSSPTSPTSNFTGSSGSTYVLRWTVTNTCGVSVHDEVSLTFQTGTTYYPDQDGDGFGTFSGSVVSCQQPVGFVTMGGDCNDANLNIRPGATEICGNTIDDDCDGQVDEQCCPVGQTFCGSGCVNLVNDINNCGSCGHACNLPNAISACNAGVCVLVSCQSGWSNADGITSNGCEFNLSTPISADAGPDQTLFCTTTATLAANTAAPAIGLWTIISGTGGSITTPSSATSTFTGQLGNTYTLRWSVGNGVNTVTDDVQISFNSCPTVANGTNTCVNGVCVITCTSGFANCDGNPANGCEVNLNNNVSNCGACGNTGTSLPNATPTCVNGLITIASCNNGWANCNGNVADGCELQISTVAANAGPDQLNVCGTNTVTLAANNPSITGTKTWTVVSGTGGSFSSTSNPTATFTGVIGQTYTLRWSINVTGCGAASSTDEVIISFPAAPTVANAGVDRPNTCGSSFTLSGNTPGANETVLWTIQSGSGGSFSQNNIAAPVFSGVPGETYVLRYTITNSICGSSSQDEMQLTFRYNDAANAGPDQSGVCSTTTLAGNTPLSSSGTWTIISGTGGSFANENLATTTFTGIPETTYTLRWSFSNSCQSSFDEVSIATGPAVPPFSRVPINFNAGTNQLNVCGTSTNLAASGLTPGNTGLWTIESGTGGSFSNVNSPTSLFTGLPGTTYQLRWTESNSCGSIFALVSISFRPSPVSNAGPDQLVVCNTLTVNLNANTPSTVFETGTWSVESISGQGNVSNFSSPTSPTSTFTGSANTSYLLVWNMSDGCSIQTARDTVQISFGGLLPTSNAGPDQLALCGNSATLAANSPGIGNSAVWSIVSGTGGSISNINANNSGFTGIPGNSYILRWTISNSCFTVSDDVTISFVPTLTVANAGIDQSAVCGTFTTVAGNTPMEGLPSWSITSGTGGSLSMINATTANFYGVAGSTYTLTYSITNACGTSSDNMQVVFNAPVSAQAGADQLNICGSSTILLANYPVSGSTGTWTIVSGFGGNFQNTAFPNTTFQGSTGSSYTLRWTISNSCSSTFDDVVVSFLPEVTTANAGQDQSNICATTTVNLAGNQPGVGSGTWSIVSGTGGSLASASSSTSQFTGLASGSYTLRWTITNGCGTSSDDVNISFGPANPTISNAGPDQLQKCGTSVTLAANTPTVGTGAWSIISGTGGTVTTTSSATSTFTGTAGSTYTLRWTISNSCGTSIDDVVISFVPTITTANAGLDQTLTCNVPTNLAANTAVNGTGAWSVVSGTGGSFGSSTAATSSFSGTAGTAYTLRWTISNGCTTSTDDVVITFGPASPTTSNAGPDQLQKCGTSVTLAANTATVGTGVWSIISGTGGTVTTTSSATSTFTGTAGSTYTLRWTISNSCGTSMDDVVISFVPTITTANAGLDQTLTCNVPTNLAANTAVNGTGAWSVVSGTGGSFGSSTAATSSFSGTAGTAYTLRWTISNGCTTSTDDVVITFGPASPTTSNAGPDQLQKCGTSVTLAANTATIGTGAWSIISGTGGTVTTTSSATSTFTGTAGSTYTLRWTISNSCGTSIDDVDISFVPTLTTAAAGSDQSSVCGGIATLAANLPSNGTGAWSIVSGTGGSLISSSLPNTQFTGTAGSTYTLRWTISNACTSSTDDVTITFGPSSPAQPSIFSTSQSTVCQGQDNVNYSVNLVSGLTYTWTYTGTGVTMTNSANSVSIDFTSTATGGELSVVASNACGQSPARSISVSVNSPAVASIEGPTCVWSNITTQFNAPQSSNSTYNWSYSGTGMSIVNGSTSTINAIFSSATSGTLTLTMMDQCLNVSTASRSITINTCTLCLGTNQFPASTVVLANSGTIEAVGTSVFAGEYSAVTLAAGKFYRFSSTDGTDRLTLTDLSNVGIASSTGELVYFSSTTQTVRLHVHTNSSCGTESVGRSTKAICLNCN